MVGNVDQIVACGFTSPVNHCYNGIVSVPEAGAETPALAEGNEETSTAAAAQNDIAILIPGDSGEVIVSTAPFPVKLYGVEGISSACLCWYRSSI